MRVPPAPATARSGDGQLPGGFDAGGLLLRLLDA
jgi:hypothetical protein